jgi:hypothetical protein
MNAIEIPSKSIAQLNALGTTAAAPDGGWPMPVVDDRRRPESLHLAARLVRTDGSVVLTSGWPGAEEHAWAA